MGKDVTSMGQNVTDVGLESLTKTELKKHAATIHCSNSLSLLQRKISNALLYHAYQELMLKVEHEISIKQLCRLIGYQGNNHAVIREALKVLISTVIEWNIVDDETGSENWSASSILASVSLEGPLCYYAYSPRMKQLLHSPSMFGKIDLVIQSRFRSSYGLALYENCIRYRGLPQTKWFELDLFKKLMGVPSGKYDVFRDFKRRVLDKAVDEVNTYSDLVISAEILREGRKVAKIRFILKERAKKTRLGPHKKADKKRLKNADTDFIKKLQDDFGLSDEQTEQLLHDYDVNFIRDKIALIEASKPYREGKIENLTAYLFSAVKNNFKATKTQQQEPISLQAARSKQDMQTWSRVINEVRDEYSLYRETIIEAAINALSKPKKKAFMQAFQEFAGPIINTILQLQRNKYTRETVLNSPQIKALLRRYAIRELDEMQMISLEEFVASLSDDKRKEWQKLKSFDPLHPLLRFNE